MAAGERTERAGALAGKNVLITRAREQAGRLCRELEARGAQAIVIPMVRFAPPEDTTQLDRTLRTLDEYDWWFLTSQNAVQIVAERAVALGMDLGKATHGVRIAAVGSATAAAAEANALRVNYIANTHSGVALAQELGEQMRGKRVLLLRSELADDTMPTFLREHGAELTDVAAYRVLPPEEADRLKLRDMNWTKIDAAIFFSPSAVRWFVDSIGAERVHELCEEVIFVAIGPTTAQALREKNFPRVLQAEDTTSEAAVNALDDYLRRTDSVRAGERRVEAKAERR